MYVFERGNYTFLSWHWIHTVLARSLRVWHEAMVCFEYADIFVTEVLALTWAAILMRDHATLVLDCN